MWWKFLTLIFLNYVTRTLALSISEDGFYDTKYNHLDIERILSNKRLVNYYALCLVGQGTCTPQGTEFKRILPEALKTNCVRCTEKQKVVAYLAIRRLKKEYPKIWQQLQAEWDPTGEYVSKFVNTIETSNLFPNPGIISQPNTQNLPSTTDKLTTTPFTTTTTTTTSERVVIINRGDFDNEISSSSLSTNKVNVPVPTPAPTFNRPLFTPASSTQSPPPSLAPSVAPNSNIPIEINTRRFSTETPILYKPIENTPKVEISAANEPVTSTVYTTQKKVTTERNYRTSFRPNRFNILLPKPGELGLRLTANFVGQIGDIGTKVIRTGARIADMVLSSVQATIG